MENFFSIFWIIIILSFYIPLIQRRMLIAKRVRLIRKIEQMRKSRVITLIHRQESLSFLGLPLARYIDIEDSERILRAIRLTPKDMPIDILLHTPGGLVLASEQIACALKRHNGKVTAFIPHYALSGGTLIALACDEIVMDADAVLGPVDPQIGIPLQGGYPATSVLEALKIKNPNRNDSVLIYGDIAKKAIRQVKRKVFILIKDKMPHGRARRIARLLSEGRWTHDYPITFEESSKIGLNVESDLPVEIYSLMELYPQAGQRRPSVEFIPLPYQPTPQTPRRGKEQ